MAKENMFYIDQGAAIDIPTDGLKFYDTVGCG